MDNIKLWESSLVKDEKRLDLITLSRSGLKGDVYVQAWSGISRTALEKKERRKQLLRLKLVCWWIVDIFNIGWDAKCTNNSIN